MCAGVYMYDGMYMRVLQVVLVFLKELPSPDIMWKLCDYHAKYANMIIYRDPYIISRSPFQSYSGSVPKNNNNNIAPDAPFFYLKYT